MAKRFATDNQFADRGAEVLQRLGGAGGLSAVQRRGELAPAAVGTVPEWIIRTSIFDVHTTIGRGSLVVKRTPGLVAPVALLPILGMGGGRTVVVICASNC